MRNHSCVSPLRNLNHGPSEHHVKQLISHAKPSELAFFRRTGFEDLVHDDHKHLKCLFAHNCVFTGGSPVSCLISNKISVVCITMGNWQPETKRLFSHWLLLCVVFSHLFNTWHQLVVGAKVGPILAREMGVTKHKTSVYKKNKTKQKLCLIRKTS